MTKPQRSAIPGRRTRPVPEAPANTAVAYMRVSTDEQSQSGAGLDAQRAAITAEAERRGWTITEWHTDEALSGGLAPSKRPALRAALASLKAHRSAALIASKLDRVSRSMADAGALLDRARDEDWLLVTCDLAADTSTPAGEAAAGMMIVFSQLERRLISQRTREALATRKAAGMQLGKPMQVPDEVLRRVISETAAGLSLGKIAAGLMADGIPTGSGNSTWHPVQVQRALDCQRGREISAEMFHEPDTDRSASTANGGLMAAFAEMEAQVAAKLAQQNDAE